MNKRHYTWNSRITQLDFVAYPVLFFAAVLALGFWQHSLSEGPLLQFAKQLIWPLVFLLMLGASKRCRDIDSSPWLGILAVLMPFGVLILLFTPGTEGDNRFGPDPRIKNKIP